jgi:Sperm-tail PG-rich repeat
LLGTPFQFGSVIQFNRTDPAYLHDLRANAQSLLPGILKPPAATTQHPALTMAAATRLRMPCSVTRPPNTGYAARMPRPRPHGGSVDGEIAGAHPAQHLISSIRLVGTSPESIIAQHAFTQPRHLQRVGTESHIAPWLSITGHTSSKATQSSRPRSASAPNAARCAPDHWHRVSERLAPSFDSHRTRQHCHDNARLAVHVYLRSQTRPGPGDYNVAPPAQCGPAFTMASRIPARRAVAPVPGPGEYDQINAAQQTGPAFTLAARPAAFEVQEAGAPGPGAYAATPRYAVYVGHATSINQKQGTKSCPLRCVARPGPVSWLLRSYMAASSPVLSGAVDQRAARRSRLALGCLRASLPYVRRGQGTTSMRKTCVRPRQPRLIPSRRCLPSSP